MAEVVPLGFLGLSGACVNAEPATDFCALVDFGFASCFAALEATLLDVFSFLATIVSFVSGLWLGFGEAATSSMPLLSTFNGHGKVEVVI